MATLSVKSRADCLEALVRSSRCAVSLLSNIRYRMFSGSDVEEEKSSHFGFQAVSEKDKTQKGAYTRVSISRTNATPQPTPLCDGEILQEGV